MSTAQVTASPSSAASAESVRATYHAPRKRLPWKAMGRHAFLIVMCLWVILPLLWVVLLSFKTLQDGTHNWIWPRNGFVDPLFTHYNYVLNNPRKVGPIWTLFRNSVLVTTLTVIAATVSVAPDSR